ncbi:ABC-ATPase domain-containing protein [Fibrobacter sp.]|uniref:ABC-ATPase domain-containing protein n=2 Tax=Fibrobacter sp. TaxID=35828 RepID=UPI00263749E1|nr:ABC-ATPase domain-containing protein [Fibrobacter sp.]MDD7498746.1 ABC-ATPase domain-containing protein [Fibrobacter sp.]MDY5725474.1 ABC-ATPase domain-containing protein [Fibrobacter sp.]
MKALYQKIRTLNGKNYGLYKSLADKPWDFGDFVLEFLHVQGDPYAPASRVVIKANLSMLGYAGEWGGSFERRLALSDFLHRKLSLLVQEKYPDKDAAVIFDVAGPEMLVRNSLWIDNGELRACLQVKLPGEGRKIQAELAAEILTMVLPDLVSAGLYYDRSDEGALQEHYRVLAERKEILSQLDACGLCAFVPNGAVLPRASGLSEMPLEKAIPFVAPEEMAVTLNVCGHEIRGMGIPKGISVITGGAFHGKSTLLQALTRSVYPHIPGDGREGIVIDETALRIGVEDGRSVRGTDLSMFVRDLPGGVSTKNFNTLSASGSTSEAANLLEAMEAGSRTFLIDEDSSAVNFLIRDVRVRKLLGDDREPLIPLTDRIKELAAAGFSFILVAGACGDYLDLADNIIVMANYKAECAKFTPAPSMSSWRGEAPTESTEPAEVTHPRSFVTYMQPLQKSVRPTSAVERQVKVKLSGDTLLQIGFLVSDTSRLNTLVDKQQRFGAGFILLNLLQNAASNNDAVPSNGTMAQSVAGVAQKLCENIKNVGFRNLPQGMSREMSLPRPVDIACVAFRLREGK